MSVREEQKNLTRNRVLDAAVTVFGEKTFAVATMEDVARAAGVTRVTVYAYFTGKGEILRALELRLYAVTDVIYAELADAPTWTRPRIRAWLDAAAARWQQMAPTIRVLTAALPTVAAPTGPRDRSDPARERYLQVHQRYVATLADDARRWRGVPRAQARQRVLMALLQLESFLSVWITRGWPVETDDPLDLLADTVCHLFAPALHE